MTYSCKDCRSLERHKINPPPCDLCIPVLYECNKQAVKIWNYVKDQRIWVGGGFGEPVGVALRHEPIWKLIDELSIPDRVRTFEKVLIVFHHIRSIENAKYQIRNASKGK